MIRQLLLWLVLIALSASQEYNDFEDVLLEKIVKASVGSFDPAFVPGLGESADFVTAVRIPAETHAYGQGVPSLLRRLEPAVQSKGFRLVFSDSGSTYMVEEPAADMRTAVARAWDSATQGTADALQTRALVAICEALGRLTC
jgi:hypothetical protein